MRQVLLALLFTSSALCAVSTVSSFCTAGTTTDSPCPGNANLTSGLSGPNYFVSAYACAGSSCSPPVSFIFAEAAGAALYTGSAPPPLPDLSAGASASDVETYYTNGPSRPGFIEFTLVTVIGSHGGLADVNITDGVHTYGPGDGAPLGSCNVGDCNYTATLPFDLGTVFHVSASAGGGGSLTPASPIPESLGSGTAQVTSFSLFEADGTTPVPFFVGPEPSSWGLLVIGLATGAWLVRRRSRSAED